MFRHALLLLLVLATTSCGAADDVDFEFVADEPRWVAADRHAIVEPGARPVRFELRGSRYVYLNLFGRKPTPEVNALRIDVAFLVHRARGDDPQELPRELGAFYITMAGAQPVRIASLRGSAWVSAADADWLQSVAAWTVPLDRLGNDATPRLYLRPGDAEPLQVGAHAVIKATPIVVDQ